MNDTGSDGSIGIRLGGPDNVSIELLQGWIHQLCFSPLLPNPDQGLRDFLIEQYFENGAALFGRETTFEIDAVRNVAGTELVSLDHSEMTQLVQYYVQRVRNYSHIKTLFAADFETARSVSDRLPESCQNHNGLILNVADMMERLNWFRTLSHEEYAQRVFGKNYGFPPFDLHCRCRMEGIIAGVND